MGTDNLSVDQLLQIFDSEFESVLGGIRVGFGPDSAKLRGSVDASGRLDSHADDIRRAKKLEIKLLVEKIMKEESKRSSGPTFVFQNSPVGVFQAGETNAVTNSTINIGAGEKETLRETLRAIADRLVEIESLTQVQRTELREVALEAETELAKPKSNWTKLRGLLSVVVAGIEKITALKDLYDVLLPVLPALGVHHVA